MVAQVHEPGWIVDHAAAPALRRAQLFIVNRSIRDHDRFSLRLPSWTDGSVGAEHAAVAGAGLKPRPHPSHRVEAPALSGIGSAVRVPHSGQVMTDSDVVLTPSGYVVMNGIAEDTSHIQIHRRGTNY
jgi:hypothetical protein